MISGEVIGGEEMVRRLYQLTGEAPLRAVAQGLVVGAERIIADAVDIVPWDEGILKGSAVVQPPEMFDDRVDVTLGFGGAASDYAIVQHENLDFNHPNGGQAKFLEKATIMNLIFVQDDAREALAAYYATVCAGVGA